MATLLEKLTLSELSLVDKGANQHAKVTIFKRADSETDADISEKLSPAIRKIRASEIAKSLYSEGDMTRAVNFRDVLSRNEAKEKTWEVREEIWPLLDALSVSINSILVDANVNDKIPAIEMQVSAFLESVKEKMPDVEEELMKFLSGYNTATAETLGNFNTATKETDMADTKTVEELAKSLDEMTAKLAKAETLAKMSDGEKAYMEKMSEGDKSAFMAMTAEDRKKKMDGVKKNDETLVVDGQTIAKSAVGADVFAIYKKMADVEKRAAELADKAEMATFEKRAASELSHLAGSDVEKALVLKAVAGIADETARTYVEGVLKARDEANAKSFETLGKRNGNDGDKSAETKIAKLAEEISKRDNISKSAAIAKAWAENPDLYNEYEGRN